MKKANTDFVDIVAGQYALAFQQPFGPYDTDLKTHLSKFSHRGGGWGGFNAGSLFDVHIITSVSPRTYKGFILDADQLSQAFPARHPRSHVIASSATIDEALSIRDQLFAIGVEADDRIEAEMYRLIAPFAKAERSCAQKKVKGLLPHIFGGQS